MNRRKAFLFKIWTLFQKKTYIVKWVLVLEFPVGLGLIAAGVMANLIRPQLMFWLLTGLVCLAIVEVFFLGYLAYQEWPTDIKVKEE